MQALFLNMQALFLNMQALFLNMQALFLNMQALFLNMQALFLNMQALFLNMQALFLNMQALFLNMQALFLNMQALFLNMQALFLNMQALLWWRRRFRLRPAVSTAPPYRPARFALRERFPRGMRRRRPGWLRPRRLPPAERRTIRRASSSPRPAVPAQFRRSARRCRDP
jgi:hypothetical protein